MEEEEAASEARQPQGCQGVKESLQKGAANARRGTELFRLQN